MDNVRDTRKKGFSLLSFLLGFLFGIIFLVGAVAGVGYFALTAPLDKVFDTVGVQNKDENGNYIIINTDTDNGGVKNALELFAAASALAGGDASVAQIEGIVPAVSAYVDQLLDMAAEYVEVDREAFRRQPFGQMAEFLKETVQDIQPAVLLEKLGMGNITEDGLVGEIIEAIIYGTEAAYVETDGQKLPVYVEKLGGGERYLYKKAGAYYSAEKTDDGYAATGNACPTVDEKAVTLSGNYYFVNGEKINENPVTLRTLTSGNAFSGLENIMLTDLIKGEEGGIVEGILGGISLGEVLSGELDFDEKINTLEVAPLLGNIPVSNNLVAYLAYGVTDITELGGVYTANIKQNGATVAVTLTVVDGYIKGMQDSAGAKVAGTVVSQITPRIDGVLNDLKIKEIIGEGENKIMQALGEYTINQIGGEIENIQFGELLEIDAESPKVLQLLKTMTIKDLNGGQFINDWQVKDIIDVEGNKMLEKLGEKTLGELQNSEFINEWKISDLVDTEGNELLSKFGELSIGDLQSGGFNDIVNGWKLNEIFDCSGNSVLEKFGEKTIAELQSGDLMNDLALDDVIDVSVALRADGKTPDTATCVLAYLVYGITDLKYDASAQNPYTAKLKVDGAVKEVVLTVEGNIITAANIKESGVAVAGAKFSEISARMNGLTADMTLGQLTGETEGILGALANSTMDTVSADVQTLKLGQILDLTESDGILWALREETIATLPSAVNGLELGQIIDIDLNDPAVSPLLKNLAMTKISEVGVKVGSLTLGQVIDIDPDNKLLSSLKDCTITGTGEGSITAKLNTLTLNEVADLPEGPLMRALGDCTILGGGANSLTAKLNSLTLQEVIDIPADNKLLNSLKTCTLTGNGENSISAKVNTLTVGDMIEIPEGNSLLSSLAGCTLTGSGEGSVTYKLDNLTVGEAIGENATGVLAGLSDAKIKNLGDEINNLTINDICETDIYADPSGDKSDPANVRGVWKVMLISANETTGEKEVRTYKISEIGRMTSNVSANIKIMTLYELVEAGVLDDPGNLDSTVVGTGKKLGEMSVTEILACIATLPAA